MPVSSSNIFIFPQTNRDNRRGRETPNNRTHKSKDLNHSNPFLLAKEPGPPTIHDHDDSKPCNPQEPEKSYEELFPKLTKNGSSTTTTTTAAAAGMNYKNAIKKNDEEQIHHQKTIPPVSKEKEQMPMVSRISGNIFLKATPVSNQTGSDYYNDEFYNDYDDDDDDDDDDAYDAAHLHYYRD
jgi:hypothetical protein